MVREEVIRVVSVSKQKLAKIVERTKRSMGGEVELMIDDRFDDLGLTLDEETAAVSRTNGKKKPTKKAQQGR